MRLVNLVARNWQLAGIKTVLFDKDGTFIDLHRYWGGITQRRAVAIARHFGGPALNEASLECVMGYDRDTGRLLSTGPVGLKSRDEVIASVVQHTAGIGISVPPESLADLFDQVHAAIPSELTLLVRVIPEAVALLEALRAVGVTLGVVTSDSVVTTEATLAQWNLAHYFSVVVGRESCDGPKITGLPARLALDLLSAEPAHTICIGDAPMDAFMAQNAGLAACVGVATGQLGASDLLAYTPHVVKSLADLRVTPHRPVVVL